MRLLSLILTASLLAGSAATGATPVKPAPHTATPARKPAAIPARPAAIPATLSDSPEITQMRQGFRFAFPIYEMMRTRAGQLAKARAFGLPNAVNFILPKTSLADASSREVTTPNNDTLYGSAWLDLAGGPVTLTIPALPGRYNSAALMAVTTDVTTILGTRTGGQGGRYTLVGPGFSGPAPAGTELIRSASNDAWLLIRVLVNGPDDLAAASAALGQFTLESSADHKPPVPTAAEVPMAPDAPTFLAIVNEALARDPDLAAKASDFKAIGIGAGWDTLSPGAQKLWTRSLPLLRAELKGGLADAGDVVDGWSYPKFAVGNYGDDNDLRAEVALGGLGALPRVEAMYLSARTDKTGAALEGSKAYSVRIPANLPVGGFWSLTMYQQEPDGRLFFVPNDLNRFAVGDRSPQLRSDRDGSYEIFVQASKPSGERVVNWLPAPKGKFVLVFRGYLPRAELLDGSFRLPPVVTSELIP